MAYDFKKLDERLESAVKFFENETASLRTGRANLALIENVSVEAYGVQNPLKNVAAIRTENGKTLVVEPWDKSLMEAIEKGIAAANLGFKTSPSKDILRAVLPDLTDDRRKSLIRLLGEKLEDARVSVRKARDEAWKDIQERERAKEISEDEKFRLKDQMEERVKKAVSKLEEASNKKEREIAE